MEIDPFKDLKENIKQFFVDEFEKTSDSISPSYLLDTPYKELLISTAKGDGKIFNIFKRAKLSESVGGALLNELVKLKILELEQSREEPTWSYQKGPIKKELRGYRIQPKVRFIHPFNRFWFGFVEPFRKELSKKNSKRFLENFQNHKDRAVSLIFEQLSNILLEDIFKNSDPIVSKGSLWGRKGEFDLLCYTKSGKIIVGECKFKARKVCKNELNKLQEKAQNSNLQADIFALFSKSGFSNELRVTKDKNLILLDLEEFKRLTV